jgi:polyhydroxybutyrate depolymerase
MKHRVWTSRRVVVAVVSVWLASCGASPGTTESGSGGSSANGGSKGTGGGGGGATGSGGTTGSGGAGGAAGAAGAGGKGGAGGQAGSGGAGGAGGAGGTAGAGGKGGAGGTSGTGGSSGSGGAGGSSGTGGSSGSSCPGTLKAGNSNETITSGGKSRTFIVHLPTGYTGTSPLPVIFDFHPLGGTGQSQMQASGWGTKCDSVGCIAVFPNSGPSDNSWNVGYCCSNSQSQQFDDVQFTRDMIKWLEANTCVDSKRIYASGCSNGGGMSYMLACKAADVIAAVAPVDFRCITGTQPANASSLTPTNNTACTCMLPRPISVTSFDEGQDNSIVPYNGGKTVVAADCPPGGSCAAFNFPSATVNFGTWANFDMCTGTPTTDPNNSICQTYMSCAGNTEVTLCTAPSGNHCGSYGLAKIVDTAWTQFQKESLP